MKIYDCFIFFNENLLTEIRFNILDKFVDYFVVCESYYDHRGNKKEYCAGYIAKIFEDMGGEVIYYGKPHKEIYKMCFNENEKVLAIGDNLRTDIKGANNLNKIVYLFVMEFIEMNLIIIQN